MSGFERLTDEQLIEQAGYILEAMAGEHQPADTEEAKEDPVTNIIEQASEFAKNVKDSAILAKKVHEQSLNKLSSWVSNVSDALNEVKGLIEQANLDGALMAKNYADKANLIGTNITSAYVQLKGLVGDAAEKVVEKVGIKSSLDHIMVEHEKMLFIALQLLAHKRHPRDDLLTPNSDNISDIIRDIVDSDHDDKRQLMIHVTKLFETFYYGKLGVSAVNSYNVVETNRIEWFVSRNNAELIKQYNDENTQNTINSIVNDVDNLKQFLINFVTKFKYDMTVDNLDHSKYFGHSQNLPDFVESNIGFNESNINFIDYKLSKESIKTRLDYYADLFKSGGSLPGYAKNIKDLYNNYEQLIIQTEKFIDGAKSEDFDNIKGRDFEADKAAALKSANYILEELKEEQKAFVHDLTENDDSPIKKIEEKINKQGLSKEVTDKIDKKIEDFKNDIRNHADDSKKVRTEEYATTEPPSGPLPFGVVRGAPKRQGPGGGRKRKTRVAANKKRKTQKKKRPSRKMKVSRKKTQRRKKKGSKKKSMKNRK